MRTCSSGLPRAAGIANCPPVVPPNQTNRGMVSNDRSQKAASSAGGKGEVDDGWFLIKKLGTSSSLSKHIWHPIAHPSTRRTRIRARASMIEGVYGLDACFDRARNRRTAGHCTVPGQRAAAGSVDEGAPVRLHASTAGAPDETLRTHAINPQTRFTKPPGRSAVRAFA